MDRTISKTRVLHIDDSLDFRGSFKSILEKEGIVVLDRRDSREAAGLLAGRDFDVLVVDSSGFEYAQQTRCQSGGATVIVLSVHPEMADFAAHAAISKNDPAWPTKALELIKVHGDDTIPPMIERSQKGFERALNELLKTRYRQWVAYHGDQQIGFGSSQTALFRQCLNRGLKEDEFIVRSIEPILADEDLVFPAES